MGETIYYQLFFQEVKEALIAERYDLKGLNEDALMKGQRIDNWPIDVIIVVQGKNPTDNLFCALKPWHVVSKKVADVLIAENIQGVQLLPVRVFHLSGIEIPGYSILNVLNIIDCLHYEKTSWVTSQKWNVQYPSLNVWKEALKEEMVRGKDIFRIAEMKVEVYVSEFLKTQLQKRQAVIGFNFFPVKAYPMES